MTMTVLLTDLIVELGIHFENEAIPPMHFAARPDADETLEQVMDAVIETAEAQLGAETKPEQRFWRFFPRPGTVPV